MSLKHLKYYLNNPKKIIRTLSLKGYLKWIPDKMLLKILYFSETGRFLNLKKPKLYSEKLQWIKLNDRKPEYTTYVDKYLVRNHIRETIGEEYLVPLIGVFNGVNEIEWGKLPKRFVIKCTHGSHSNIICTDKKKLNISKAKSNLKKWMKHNWFWFAREWPYKNIKPRIIIEEFLTKDGSIPNDYKVLCFNGKAKLIEIHEDRFDKNHTQDFYDIEWNKTSLDQISVHPSVEKIPKPKCLEEMIKMSEILAKDMYHVRIDWYVENDNLYFGEITFFDGAGLELFKKEDDEILLGSWIKLPIDKM